MAQLRTNSCCPSRFSDATRASAGLAPRGSHLILQSVSRGCVALLPVLVFLAALIYFDSFKLVGLRHLGRCHLRRRAGRRPVLWHRRSSALRRLDDRLRQLLPLCLALVIEETMKAMTARLPDPHPACRLPVRCGDLRFRRRNRLRGRRKPLLPRTRPDSPSRSCGQRGLWHRDHARRRDGDLRIVVGVADRAAPGLLALGLTARPPRPPSRFIRLQPLPVPPGDRNTLVCCVAAAADPSTSCSNAASAALRIGSSRISIRTLQLLESINSGGFPDYSRRLATCIP